MTFRSSVEWYVRGRGERREKGGGREGGRGGGSKGVREGARGGRENRWKECRDKGTAEREEWERMR